MMDENFPFPLQILLKDKTKIHVTHFPASLSPSEKLRDIAALYNELLEPTGVEQGSEDIRALEPDEKESDEEEQSKRLAATQFLEYAEQTGIEAMALLLQDRKSTAFISTYPDAAAQNRQDMLQALRNIYPSLRGAPDTSQKGRSRVKRPKV